MEKEFFDVFPNLKVKDQLHEWLEMVTVSRVSCNPAKTRLWVYIHSERWIHKKNIMALEDQIERQCFSGLEIQVTVIERFHLSRQYSPANFLEVYRSSMEVELKNFNMLEYNLFKRAQIAFPSDEQMDLTLPDSVISREKSGILVEYLEKGEIDPDIVAECELQMGAFERWNGHRGFGPLNARLAMDRACELAKEYGIGLVALGNNNHWMRGGSYGFQAADKGCIGICWSNTCPNMPAWGGRDRKIGNNPIIFAVPRSNGQHVVIDCAVSQFSYGKIEDCRLKGVQLPVPGGYDTNGNLTTDPAEIEKTWRVLPMGYWKGSGISIALDLIATVLTNGNSVSRIGTFGDEVGLSQIMIAIDPLRFNTPEETDSIVDEILADIKSSEPIREGGEVYYPGELELKNIKENKEQGIPVIEEVWESILKM